VTTRSLHHQIGIVIGLFASVLWLAVESRAADSLTHMDAHAEKPQPWPDAVIPYDVSKLISDLDAERARLVYGVRKASNSKSAATGVTR
jgi:hypothetical protein